MQKIFTIFSFLIVLSISLLPNSEQGDSSFHFNAIRVRSGINLDGVLNEPEWNTEPVSKFTQREPDEGKPATERSFVWAAYDDEYFYIAAKLLDSNAAVIDASLARRDTYYDSDWFYVFIDPYFDRKTGYYFGVNAGGTRNDGIVFNDDWDTSTWDGVWEAKTHMDETGWSLEIKIPFSQLRFREAENMQWGINFKRIIKKKNESSYLSMVPKKESGFASRFAILDGLKGIKPKQRIEVIPYLVQKSQYLKHDAGDPFYSARQYRTTFGGDIKVGIGSNLNLDITLNPDFGQVEVDPAVVNLSAFESYFDEKRPFFIEGSDIFQFGFIGANSFSSFNFGIPELFYSRRIGRAPQADQPDYDFIDYPNETRILGAMKLTGKINESLSMGAISAMTERTFGTVEYNGKRSTAQIEPFTHYGIFRALKEFNKGSSALGLMVTDVNRDLPNTDLQNQLAKSAYVLGLDSWQFLDKDKEYVLTGVFSGSHISGSKDFMTDLQQRSYRYFQRPDATYAVLDSNRTSLDGWYGRIMLNKQKGNFILNTALGAVSPGFEQNDLGFQFMADRINGHILSGYAWYEPDGVFRSKNILGAFAQSYDFEGNLTHSFLWSSSSLKFMNYWGVSVTGYYFMEVLSKSLTRGGPMAKVPDEFSISINAYTDTREKISFTPHAHYTWDGEYGYSWCFGPTINWRPNTKLNISFQPHYEESEWGLQYVDNVSDELALATYKNRYIFARMNQKSFETVIRIDWTFTPALSLQLYLQPMFSVGKYNQFKELARPASLDYTIYGTNGSTIESDKINDQFIIDPDGNGPASQFTIDNPDFNFKSLRGTMVLRWELMPGSSLYLVWTHEQSNEDDPGSFQLNRDVHSLLKTEADNIFLMKFSYWFNL